jgi:hypothetical protein
MFEIHKLSEKNAEWLSIQPQSISEIACFLAPASGCVEHLQGFAHRYKMPTNPYKKSLKNYNLGTISHEAITHIEVTSCLLGIEMHYVVDLLISYHLSI